MGEEFENYNSVVVNLEPNSDGSTGVTTATYDQAFLGEEFSELRGRGAERRKQRQMARQQRQAKRQETGRRARKARRQMARQEQRARRQEARMGRKEARMNQRNQRRIDKQNQEEEADSESTDEEELPQNGGSDSGEDTGYDSGSDSGEDQGYDSEEDQGYDSGEDQGYDSSYEEADESFAGDSSNFSAEITGKPSVPNNIQAIANKIELTDQMINQLMQYKKMLESRGQSTAKISSMIGEKSDQLEFLESKLDNFSGADGSVDPMKEKVIDIATQKAKSNITKRKIAWHQDKIVSLRQQRDALPKGGGNNMKRQQFQNQIDNQKAKIVELQGQMGTSGFDGDTMSFANGSGQIKAKIAFHQDKIVSLRQQRDALPKGGGNNMKRQQFQNQINNQKAKIAELKGQLGTSGFDGDFDSPVFDYDQPQSQIVDLDAPSNFSGSDSSNNYMKTLLIGGAIAIATIYVVRKYNLLK